MKNKSDLGDMNLKKWYLDFVSDEGVAALCYSAKLRYKGVSIGYSALVNGSYNGDFTAHYSLQSPRPEFNDTALQWQASKWDTAFSWQTGAQTVSQPISLWQTEKGGITWHNLIPGAQAHMQQNNQMTSGLGYVEQLSLDIPPWRLPIKRLRWGRFVSRQATLVWIEWHLRDGSTKQWLTHDGQAVEAFSLDAQTIISPQGYLQIGRGSPIRQGYLKDTAFSSIAFLRWFFPDPVLNIYEHKQLAPATFYSDAGQQSEGWVIDEIVDFP